nr:LTA synthase family protein [Pararobbsia alpina]
MALSFAFDAIAAPRAPARRSMVALSIHVLGVVFVFLCMVLVSGRAQFSSFVSAAVVGLLAAVSNAKYASLREPFVFTDLSLFSQLFAHPRLYLPFLSASKVLAIALGTGLLIAGFLLEKRHALQPAIFVFLAACACLVVGSLLAARLPLSLIPSDDQRRHGFFAVFVAYLLNGLRPATWRTFRRAMESGPFTLGAPAACPDVVVIQSESFFDARRLGSFVRQAILSHHDVARSESVEYGELTVPAWGANTMRTEFAMLSGLPESLLGYARFYPYAFVRHACASLASWFKRAGYRTLAIHPYYANFFGRDRVFRLLHIDKFLDIASFANARHAGPYVGDAAVADAIIHSLETGGDEPAFIFAMTMENHGPLNLETVEPGEATKYHTLGDGAHWHDLTAYLRHLANADAMIAALLEYLRTRRRKTVLCFYGDHVPALPHIFGKLDIEPARSDYFIWRNFGEVCATERHLSAEELGAALIRAIDRGDMSDATVGTLRKMAEQ